MAPFFYHLTVLQLCLLALITPVLGKKKLSYPTTVEVNLLFPRNETYNNMTGFPIVFAIQNAKAVDVFGWTLEWKFVWLDGDKEEKFLDHYTGPDLTDSSTFNEFRYIADDSFLAPGKIYTKNNYYLRPGTYLVNWEYRTSVCWGGKSRTYINGNSVVARSNSTVIFTAVDDGSGRDFEIPSDVCPLYTGQWTATESEASIDCPGTDSSSYIDPDPCAARISSEQISCLQDWFGGNNESEACQSSVKRWDVLGESAAAAVAHVPTMASFMLVLFVGLTMCLC